MEILENVDAWYNEYKEGWLAHYQQTGEFDWKIYNRPTNRTATRGRGINLAKSKLILISSAGSYLADRQKPFDAPNPLGDYTIRLYSSDTPLEELAIAHDHYDHAAIDADRQVLIPLRHLEDMVSEGIIGELCDSVISFHGYQPDVTRLINETIPEIFQAAKDEGAQAALLVPA